MSEVGFVLSLVCRPSELPPYSGRLRIYFTLHRGALVTLRRHHLLMSFNKRKKAVRVEVKVRGLEFLASGPT